MMRTIWLALCLCAAPSLWAQDLSLLPETVQLHGPDSFQRMLALDVEGGEYTGLATDGVAWSTSDDAVISVDGAILRPVGNGQATVTVKRGDKTASATVEVSGMQADQDWSFRHHVLPVLAKNSCNSGACHGALAGKGGMKLSLRGYDPAADYRVITREARGRRMELADPARSLIVCKPSGSIPHKGGVRIDVGSRDYRVLVEWIAHGAVGPSETDAKLERLEILPEVSTLKPGDVQPLVVRAHYSGGRVEDVTDWCIFTSANEAVASVNRDGEVSVIGPGEGAISAWFSSQIVLARVTVPYANDVAAEVFAESPKRNFIDELVVEQLRRLNLPPSPRCDDSTFIRRAYMDTIGLLPTTDEVRAFLADESHDKRDRLIESLLNREEFVDYWTYRWSDILLINGTKLRPDAVKSYYQWVRGHVKDNTPWDEFVRQVVTASGESLEDGATNFYALHQTPEEMTENVSQAFLSLSLGCAKCHNHPLEKWTNDQYYAMANMFARVRGKGWGGDGRSGNGARTTYVASSGELVQPSTGRPQPPTPLDGEPIAMDDPLDRRVHLAKWLTSPENPYFARAITNRVWANYYGVGLVEAIDDLRVSNPASNEKLLSAAADYLVENKFDLKALMRAILQSETYQRSSDPLPGNAEENRFYSRYYPRRMMAEVLLDAISQTTGVPEKFDQIAFPGADFQNVDFYPKGTRAVELYDSAVASYFLRTFGRNPREITCECERSAQPSMVQVLHLSNGTTLNDKLAAKESRVSELLAKNLPDDQLIDEVYLACLARSPSEKERAQLLEFLSNAEGDDRRIVIEDLYWAILSSREFLFHH